MRLGSNNLGYKKIVFSVNGDNKTKFVHRLVAQAFIPNPENKPQVNHKNGIKDDNRVENLEWCTPLENINHAISNGLMMTKGEDNFSARLKKEDVISIRSYKQNGISTKELCSMYGMEKSTINKIISGKLWKSLA